MKGQCAIKRCMRKCRRTRLNVFREFTVNCIHRWRRWSCLCSGDVMIPSDVPKGHLAVYVGEDCKRFVIKVDLLNHPLFEALLDSAEQMFESTRGQKLCIPCNETSFLCILESATENLKLSNCF